MFQYTLWTAIYTYLTDNSITDADRNSKGFVERLRKYKIHLNDTTHIAIFDLAATADISIYIGGKYGYSESKSMLAGVLLGGLTHYMLSIDTPLNKLIADLSSSE